ncbi:MAG TPA: GspH/FimT family pseudopilin [Gammaproteobacteria bacterium]
MEKVPQNGFTLLEMLITILVISIVASITVPAMGDLVRDNRLTTSVNDFIASVTLARSEAIKRSAPVTVCISDNPTAANPACDAAAGGEWETGWVVFADADGDAVIDAGETLLQQHAPLAQGVDVETNAVLETYVSFSGAGRTRDTANAPVTGGRLVFCDDRGITDTGGGESTALAINLAGTGRPQSLNQQSLIVAMGITCP